MADIPTGQPAAAQPAAGVEPSSAAGVTPADADRQQARTQLQELKADPQWSRRFLDHYNKPGSPERAQFDALTERMNGQPATPQPPEPTEAERARAGLEPPPTPNDYKLTDFGGRPIELDAANQAIVHDELLPAAHSLGLSQLDINMISPGVLRPQTYQAREQFLRRTWGANYDARMEDFHTVLEQDPRWVPLFERFWEQLGNNGPLIAGIVSAYRRRQGKR